MAQFSFLKETDELLVTRDGQSYKVTYDSVVSALNEDLDIGGGDFVKVEGDTMTGTLHIGNPVLSISPTADDSITPTPADLIVEKGNIYLSDYRNKKPSSFSDRRQNKLALFDDEGKLIASDQYELEILDPNNDSKHIRYLDVISIETGDVDTSLPDGVYTDVPMYDMYTDDSDDSPGGRFPEYNAANNGGTTVKPENQTKTTANGFNATFDIKVEGGKIIECIINQIGNSFPQPTDDANSLIELDTHSKDPTVEHKGQGPVIRVISIGNDFVGSSTTIYANLFSSSPWIENSFIGFKSKNSELAITKNGNVIELESFPVSLPDLTFVTYGDSPPDISGDKYKTTEPLWFNTEEGRLYVQFRNTRSNPFFDPNDTADTIQSRSITESLWIEANPNAIDGNEFIDKLNGDCDNIRATGEVSAVHFKIDHLPVLP